MRPLPLLIMLLSLTVAKFGLTAAETTLPATLYCPEARSPVVIDGDLSEPAWQFAAARNLSRPGGLAPLNPSTVKILWRADALYVAFAGCDMDLVAGATQRDARLWERDDIFEIFIGAPGAAFRRLELQFNPLGTLTDLCLIHGESESQSLQWNWPGIEWKCKILPTVDGVAQGWTVEAKLPFTGIAGFTGAAPNTIPACRILFAQMNRVRIADNRIAREKSFWPPAPSNSPDQIGEYAILKIVPASLPEQPMEGFCRIVSGQARRHDALRLDYRGESAFWEYETAASDAVLIWQGETPQPVQSGTHTFAFVAQTDEHERQIDKTHARFTLSLNNRRLLEFEPFQTADKNWSEGPVRLSFRRKDKTKSPSGVFVLSFPHYLLPANTPPTFGVRWTGKGPSTTFYLKAYTDAALFDVNDLH